MTPEHHIFSPAGILGITDILAALLMLWSMIKITTPAGWRSTQARWALFRRGVYGMMTISLFGLGIGRVSGRYPIDAQDIFFQIILLVGVMVFPLLRAFGLISQDTLLLDRPASGRPTRARWQQ